MEWPSCLAARKALAAQKIPGEFTRNVSHVARRPCQVKPDAIRRRRAFSTTFLERGESPPKTDRPSPRRCLSAASSARRAGDTERSIARTWSVFATSGSRTTSPTGCPRSSIASRSTAFQERPSASPSRLSERRTKSVKGAIGWWRGVESGANAPACSSRVTWKVSASWRSVASRRPPRARYLTHPYPAFMSPTIVVLKRSDGRHWRRTSNLPAGPRQKRR